jgi:hypothetical protein
VRARYYADSVLRLNEFRVQVFADDNGNPALSPFYDEALGVVDGTPLFEGIMGRMIYRYEAQLPPLQFEAGTFWLSVGANSALHWMWSHPDSPAPAGNDSYFRESAAASWKSGASVGERSPRLDQAFTLANVPEPSSLLLMLGAMAVLRSIGRNRRRTTIAATA